MLEKDHFQRLRFQANMQIDRFSFIKILPKVLFRTDFTDSRAPLFKEYFLHMGFDTIANLRKCKNSLYIKSFFANRMDLLLLQSNLEQ